MNDILSDAVVIEPLDQHRHTVNWLHGLGADGYDFVPIVRELALPAALGVRFVFPHAPVRPVTVNGGYAMRAWYDILFPDLARFVDAAGIRASTQALRGLLEQEVVRVGDWGRILLAGFSQGGAVALQTALSGGHDLAGMIALSTYLPLRDGADIPEAAPRFPVFWGHGTQDTVVPFVLGSSAREFLRGRGHPLTERSYPMPHSVCPAEVDDIRAWLLARLATEAA
jgi:phospholipase/carboxylesterase